MGAAVWVVLGSSRLFTSSLLYLYVLGHELTHVLAVFCSRGSIHAFKADLDGGYIQTDKNNLFISLSPYFLPLWAMLWGLVWGMAYLFWPTVTCQALLYSGLGFWWCFHLFWTAWIIPKDQPDLADNGTFFSLILVYFANLLLFLVLLRLFNACKPDRFLTDCVHNAERLWTPSGTSSCWRPACSCEKYSFPSPARMNGRKVRNPTFQQKGDSMQATHFITLTMAAVSLMAATPRKP